MPPSKRTREPKRTPGAEDCANLAEASSADARATSGTAPAPAAKGEAEPPSSPLHCEVVGLTDATLTSKRSHAFEIICHDASGTRKTQGGEVFFVAIRGASRVRARVTDREDGSYMAEWTPTTSGIYHVSTSLFGVSLRGSPFTVQVEGPSPFAPNCEARRAPPPRHRLRRAPRHRLRRA